MRKLIIIAASVVPASASAGGYVIPNETARDLALSQAAVADQNGAESIFLNVAALAGQDGLDVSANGELLINRTDWSDPDLGKASMDPQTNTPPALAASFGQKLDNDMAWGAGIGFNIPAGGSLGWPKGWAGQEYIQSVSQKVYQLGVGAAFKANPYIKVGASLLYFRATEELHQSINYLDHYGDAALAMAGDAVSFGLGAEGKIPTIPLTLAVTYHHSGDLGLDGHAHFTDVPPAFQPMLHDQTVTESLKIPYELYVGAAYEVYPDLKVMAAWNLEGWNSYKEDKFVGSSGFTVTVPRNYNNAYVFRVGGEWVKTPFLPQLTLRAGFLRSISDQPKDTVSPSLTDGNSTAFSLGAGFNVMPELRIDVGYQHAIFDDVKADGTEVFPGTYSTMVDLISIGVNWRTDLGMRPRAQ